MIQQFGGYNHNMRIGSGEFYDMMNLTSSYFPLLAPRQERGFYTGGGNISGMIAKDQLCYVDGQDFVIGSQHVNMDLTDDERHPIGFVLQPKPPLHTKASRAGNR